MLEIRPLAADDLGDATRLSAQAGWNQLEADWKRFRSLCPDGCFAGTVDETVVATTTVLTYEDVSWIGMVLVDEAHRSLGYGTQIFEHGLEYAHAHGGDVVGLDATHVGEPIYRSHGFERVEPVRRWQGTLRESTRSAPGGRGDRIEPLEPSDTDALCVFDRRHVEVDRGSLLRTLVGESSVRGFVSRGSSGIDGYALVRPGRTSWHLGPVVAADSRTVDSLLRAVSTAFDGRDVIVDAPDRDASVSHLESIGLSRSRELVRMTYPEAASALLTDDVYAFVDFAFG